MTPTLILFLVLAVLAIVSALGMLFSRNAVFAALYLIANFVVVALFYLMLEAPFIAISQVTVYAGAIMVLFLFVVMLLGAEQTGRTPARWWLQPAALALGALMLIELVIIVVAQGQAMGGSAAVLPENFGDPLAVGQLLFSRYLLPFEATSVLLLVAMIGAIVMTRAESKSAEKKS
jgi:NADH-quinone oxidoreductase subunit J